jgi:hypothetical protein
LDPIAGVAANFLAITVHPAVLDRAGTGVPVRQLAGIGFRISD